MPSATGPTIAAVVYSRNEAALLGDCLDRITGFDELVVCDMQSTDSTPVIASAHGARLVTVPDARVIEEVRQQGLDAAGTEWVLFVDADEHLPDDFALALRAMLEEEPEPVAWRLHYANVAFGATLQHTLRGSAKFALMRCDATRYAQPGRAHVPPTFQGSTADAGRYLPEILHHNFREAAQSLEKTLRYAPDVEAPAALLSPWGFLRAAVRSLVFGGSWRDGRPGVSVATMDLFGRWYAALLAAERDGTLGDQVPLGQQRALGLVGRAQRVAVSARERLSRRSGRPARTSERDDS